MTNQTNNPLISCLCLTRKRTQLLKRAALCFQAQTYPNKELIIVFGDDDPDTKRVVEEMDDEKFVPIEVKNYSQMVLGEIRNLSIEKSNGDYICQWDDDDWYHKARLEMQMNAIKQNYKPVCLLAFCLMFDMTRKQAYLSSLRGWENTILCKKSVITDEIKYGILPRGEDTVLISKLTKANYIYPLVRPNLYIYIYHGNNTWGYNHFNLFFEKGQKLSSMISIAIQDILENKYSPEKASEILDSPSILEGLKYT